MNNQSCESALPPSTSAGPSERAGLTEVPVMRMPTRWITVSVRPIARPAIAGCEPLPVAPSITSTKMKVATASNRKAAPWL